MVLEAAQQVPGLGYCGWDVCFLPDRPALMEGNAYPSHALVQMQVHRAQTAWAFCRRFGGCCGRAPRRDRPSRRRVARALFRIARAWPYGILDRAL